MLNTSRRSLLASLPAAAVAVAIPSVAIAATGDDAAIKAAWGRWQDARRTYNALPFPDDDKLSVEQANAAEAEENRLWAIMDAEEETIRTTTATTKRGVAIQLWIALSHSISWQWQEEAMLNADLAAIVRTEASLDFNARLIVSALRSLELNP